MATIPHKQILIIADRASRKDTIRHFLRARGVNPLPQSSLAGIFASILIRKGLTANVRGGMVPKAKTEGGGKSFCLFFENVDAAVVTRIETTIAFVGDI
jgi:hypothetical protein